MNSLSDITFTRMDGTSAALKDYQGKVLLLVNVASKCGLTPQYEGLENLYREYKDQGLEILAFPANNFMGQEPGTNEDIQSFCKLTYDVSFPLFQKISVKGDDQHPLYKELTSLKPDAQKEAGSDFEGKLRGHGLKRENPSDILWNFEKFLIDKDGKVAARFAPDTSPTSDLITSKIKELL